MAQGKHKRVPPAEGERTTDVVSLDWFVDADRWGGVPAILLEELHRFAPEALPTRYGEYEPLQHRLALPDIEEFCKLVGEPSSAVFWHAARPSFGGSAFGPATGQPTQPDDEGLQVGNFRVTFDAAVLRSDHRWLETVEVLFGALAAKTGALYAAAQVKSRPASE